MGATYTRQSTYEDGDTITAAHTNDEFDQLLASFQASSGHTHDGTANEGGPISKLLSNGLTFGSGADSDITIAFDTSGSDGELKWMHDDDRFQFSDDIMIVDNEQLIFGTNSDVAISYDETTTDSLKIAATEGAGLAITLMADEGDDAGDEWKLNIADGGTLTLGNDINSAGTYVTHLTITPNSTVANSTMAVAGNIDVDGTANLDAVDIDGAVQIDGTVTVGANDQGYDVILYGDTASANVTWDTSADDLIFNGAAGLIIPDGQLTLGSTAVASTATELNLLDGSSANSVVNSKAVIYGSSGELAGTLSTAAQANITSVGTLTTLTIDDILVDGKVITLTGSSGDTATITASANGALDIATTDAAGAAGNIQITADGTAELAGTTVTLDSEGGITLDANGGTITFADDGSSLGTVTSSGFTGNVVGNVTGNVSGTAGSATGSAATLATPRAIGGVNFDGSAAINLPGVNTAGNQNTSGTAAIATAVTVSDNESTNENNVILFGAGAAGSGNIGVEADGNMTYNPSTGKITATGFIGALTGDVAGNLTGTVATATQNSITTATGLTSTGALNAGSITSGFGAIDNGASAITTTGAVNFGAATVDSLDASEGNITNVGSIALDSISADNTALAIVFNHGVAPATHIDTSAGGSTAPNFSEYTNFVWTLTSNLVLTDPGDEVAGQSGVFVLIQDAGGTNTISTAAAQYFVPGATELVLSTAGAAVDVIPYMIQADGKILLGAVQLAFGDV
tara:strand:- start:1547 stop:3790 length:2244 start_codon:yes stop_codon:yes gene_type:complete